MWSACASRRQPTIIRLNASVMKQTYASPTQVGTYVRSVTHSGLGGRGEVAPLDQVRMPTGVGVGLGGAAVFACTPRSRRPASAGDLVAAHVVSGPAGRFPQLPRSVDLAVCPHHRRGRAIRRHGRPAPTARGTWPRSRCSGPPASCGRTVQMGSTPNSSRLSSMKSTITCVGGRAPPRRKLAARFRISLARLSSRFSCSSSLIRWRLVGRRPRGVPVVDVGLVHPRAHRLDAVPELASDPLHGSVLGAQFGAQRPHHPHRGGLLLRAVAARRRLPGDCSFGMTPSSFPR